MRSVWFSIFGFILFLAAVGGWWVYQDSQKVYTLTVAAGPRGSDAHTLMKEIAEVAIRHSETVRLDVRASRNSSDNISMINNGTVDLATVQSNTPAYTTVNLVTDLFADYFMLIAREDKVLYRVQDLIAKRVAIPEDGSTGSMSFWSVIDHYSIPPESFRSVSVPRVKGVEAFLSGQVDAIFMVNSLRDPFLLLNLMEEARLRGIGLRFIPINQAKAMSLKRPYLEPRTIVKGAFDGGAPMPVRNIITPSVHRLLVAGVEVEEEAIHELVKVIFENRLDLLIRMSLSSAITNPQSDNGASLSVHPGAAQFYDRDKPSFLQENSESMAFVITIFAMVGSALLALRKNLKNSAKNRGDIYNVQLLDISNRARKNKKPKELVAMHDELTSILETVIHALDTDEVTEDSFQSFSFLWKSTQDLINKRLDHLKG
ncbi:MAG: TAXI family TRAP transporter solute-binding subunit [Rhizobiaceae bacterium]